MTRLAAAALALALLGGAGGCRACATTSATFERRAAEGSPPGTAAPLAPPIVRVLHFADFGKATRQQAAVASAIGAAQRRRPFDLAFHAGDNVYPCGPDWRSPQAERCAFAADGSTVVPGYVPPPDPAYLEAFEGALGPLVAGAVPVYLALGNHDVSTWRACLPSGDAAAVARAKACLEVARSSPAWRMPGRHYVVDRGPARFIVLDSEVVEGDYGGGFTLADEIAFLRASSAGCDAKACFVVTHHPAATAGRHVADFTPEIAARMERLVAAAGGHLRGWLAGHDHDLQHARTAGGLDVFISGNGCCDRKEERFEQAAPPGSALLYGSVRWGFAILEVSETGFTWRVEDEAGTPRYCCAATRTGAWSRCEPVACD